MKVFVFRRFLSFRLLIDELPYVHRMDILRHFFLNINHVLNLELQSYHQAQQSKWHNEFLRFYRLQFYKVYQLG